MDVFKTKIIELLKKATNLEEIELEIPNPEFGDFAFPCFKLAKRNKKNPSVIAKELAEKINHKISVKAVGPYLNFFINSEKLAELTLKKILKEKDKFGSNHSGKGKNALIEHTSINPNASPHVGRARNALIGDSLTRLLKFEGYKTEVHYWVNDIGKQIAMLVLGYKKKKVKFDELLEIYKNINEKIEKNPELEKDVLELLNKLEKGNAKIKNRFKEIVKICIDGQIKIFKELGIGYDFFDYESKYLKTKEIDKILKKLSKTGRLFKDKENRYILNQEKFKLEMKSPVLVLTRSDGTSLYPLRDIIYTIEKIQKIKDMNIVVLGEDQKLYFKQIAAALSLLGYKAPKPVHYSFVLLKKGKMSTRKGNVVLLEDFMKEAREKAEKEISKRKGKKNKELEKIIGYGAIKYAILKVSSDKNVVFDWKNALSFEGETAPYIQYAHARICSILRKHNKTVNNKVNYSLLNKNEEIRLVKQLSNFNSLVKNALTSLQPHLIANYTYEVAKQFNEFYHTCPVLIEKEEVKKARLLLIDCTRQVLKNGLNLLGINAPEKM